MFHAHGVSLYSTAVRAAACYLALSSPLIYSSVQVTTGIIIGVFPPMEPPVFPTPENVFEGAVAVNADYIVTVPPYVEVRSSC